MISMRRCFYDGLLLDSLYDERNLYVKDRLRRQIKLLITPFLLSMFSTCFFGTLFVF
jgi:hypothetical protein